MTDFQRFIVIMTIVVGLIALGSAVALGHVEEKSSYGLSSILLIVGQIVSSIVKGDKNKGSGDDDPKV